MPSQPCKSNSNAERLKAQGNEFHRTGQFRAAREKYSAAIKEDPTNAIYYANRAASSLALKEYLDAASDAEEATKLDPSYAKAWSRLGSASYGLSVWGMSVDAYKKALQCLPPPETATSTELRLRAEVERDLAKSQTALESPPRQRLAEVLQTVELPWVRAAAMEKEVIALNKAQVILEAYREFKHGVVIMRKLETKVVAGGMSVNGTTGSVSHITNAVLRDMRVFHMDGPDWKERLQNQVAFEAQATKSWHKSGPEVVKREVHRRLKNEGWDSVRPALSTTVRGWMLTGLITHVTGNLQAAIEFYSRALDIVEWGARTWPNLSQEERGVIFEKTFIRGVKKMKVAVMLDCLTNEVENLSFTITDMVNICSEIVLDTNTNPPVGEIGACDYASFWLIPKAEAAAAVAWYSKKMGDSAATAEQAQVAYTKAATLYIEAAGNYPEDDEKILTFYRAALEAYWLSPDGKTVKDMLEIIQRISSLLPGIMKIWEHSATSTTRNGLITVVLEIGSRFNEAVVKKRVSLDDVVRPKEIQTIYKWGGNTIYI